MKRITVLSLSALLGACASVPQDAGLADVQRAVAARTNVSIDARPAGWTEGGDRIQAMLHDELTAEEAVAMAMSNNPRLQATLTELGIARADLIAASTITNPLFEFEIRFPGEPYRPYELRLAQSLIDLIQLPRRRAVGRAGFDAAQMRVTSEVLRFAGEVRSTYYDLVAASQHAALSRTSLEASIAAAELAIKQHAAGNITDLDLENQQALYEQAKLDLAVSEKQLVVARESAIRAFGLRDATVEWRVPQSFGELAAAEPTQEQLEESAAKQRLDIAIARREIEIAERRIPAARLSALNDSELDVHYEREPDGTRTVGPGIIVPIPIFDTGRAARTRAEAELLRARHTLDALLRESSSRIRTAHVTVAEARARVEYYRDVLLPRRRRIVELTKLEHNAMLVGAFQLLQAWQNETQAHRDFVEAQRAYWTARIDLDRAMNGIAGEPSFTPATPPTASRRAALRGSH